MNEVETTTSDKLAKTGNFIKSLMWKILFFAVIVGGIMVYWNLSLIHI